MTKNKHIALALGMMLVATVVGYRKFNTPPPPPRPQPPLPPGMLVPAAQQRAVRVLARPSPGGTNHGSMRTNLVLDLGIDPNNGKPGYLDCYTVVEETTNNGKIWTMIDMVWGPTNYWTNNFAADARVCHEYRTRWSLTNIVIHPL